jgi:hypothetical protein
MFYPWEFTSERDAEVKTPHIDWRCSDAMSFTCMSSLRPFTTIPRPLRDASAVCTSGAIELSCFSIALYFG